MYNEQVTISKSIVLQGSGYEYTQIVTDASPAVIMSSGEMMWFSIFSHTGIGVNLSGGDTLTKCVIWNCPSYGVSVTAGTSSIIQNCDIILDNPSSGYYYPYSVSYDANGTFLSDILWNFSEFGAMGKNGNATEMYCIVENRI